MRFGWRLAIATAVTGAALALAGCQNFFVCDKASCPSSGSGSTTTNSDLAFVGYTALDSSGNATSTINGYDVSKGALTSTGSSLSLSYKPLQMVVAPSNNYLYVASMIDASTPGVYGYTISSTGTLTAMSGNPLITDQVGSIALSPDGGYLYVLDATGGATSTLLQYTVNTSTGALTSNGSVGVPQSTCGTIGSPAVRACEVKTSPSGSFVTVSLNANGQYVYPYSSSKGLTSTSGLFSFVSSAALYDFGVAWDKSDDLYIARTTQLANVAITSTTYNQVGTGTYATGTQPRAVALNTGYTAVYTADPSDSTIAGFSISSGALTALSPATTAGPTNVEALGFEKSGAYAVAVGYNTSSGVQLYTVNSSTYALTSTASAGTTSTTTYPVSLALTH